MLWNEKEKEKKWTVPSYNCSAIKYVDMESHMDARSMLILRSIKIIQKLFSTDLSAI